MAVSIKTPTEIEKMRVAGRLAAEVLEMIGDYVEPGISTGELDKICHDYIVNEQQAIPAPLNYKGFPKSICTSVNQVICHGIPSDNKVLKDGDIINIDITVIKDGYHGDTSKMFFVGKAQTHAIRLVEVTQECLYKAIDIIKPGTRLGGVVKGNAYGHGFAQTLPAVHGAVDVLYAVTAGEALWIRDWEQRTGAPRKEILVIGVLSPREAVACARAGVDVVLADAGFVDHARAVAEAGLSLGVHVHLDTGLSREGLLPEDVDEALAWLDAVGDAVVVRGVLMHFADVEDVTEQTWARRQLARFEQGRLALSQTLSRMGRPTGLVRHAAASAAAMVLDSSHFDVVRAGIALYGLWPSRETRIGVRALRGEAPRLRPVLSWRVPVQAVKQVPSGTPVGYGCTWTASRPTRLAVLPVGYFDGYPRILGNRAHVLVHGARCPVVGRVMMNHLVVDVTDAPSATCGDVATLLGRDGEMEISADALATAADTIHYELVTRIGAHVPRKGLPTTVAAGQGAPGHGPEGPR